MKAFVLVAMTVAVIGMATLPAGAVEKWPPVPPADLAKLKAADFRDDELDLPYYLAHFHRVANAVVEDGPDRGFIGIAVWRATKDNKPYNARIMESILTLAYFYTTDRPWNPYRGTPAVRVRLEAAMDFWCRMQNADGQFSEYSAGGWNLAATAFATKFMGRTLALLKDGPPIDAGVLKRAADADRRAIMATLTLPDLYAHGKGYSNQFTNVYAGAPAYLRLYPDAEVERVLTDRMKSGDTDFQSPCGFFYEADGPDFGYSLYTHHQNLWMAYHYLRGTPLGEIVVEEDRRWNEWLSYNLVRQPDGGLFVVNRAIETRQRKPYVIRQDNALAEVVPTARAFSRTTAEVAADVARTRCEVEKTWPTVPDMEVGLFRAYAPYVFLQRDHVTWHPTPEQQAAAVAALPYLARDRFTHQRVDDRRPLVCTYVRRPAYYAAMATGSHHKPQRLGLGLVWTPSGGAVLQSQTDTNDRAWGTVAAGAKTPYEAGPVRAAYTLAEKPLTPETGNRDLAAGDLAVTYPLGKTGQKTVTFTDAGIAVAVKHPGEFTEFVPLLAADGETVDLAPGRATLRRAGGAVTVEFDPSAKASVKPAEGPIPGLRLMVLRLAGKGSLSYTVKF